MKIFDNYRKKSFFKFIDSLNLNTKILYLTHSLGGGAEFYLKNKIAELANDNCIITASYLLKTKKFNITATYKKRSKCYRFHNFQDLSEFLNNLRINQININQISFFHNIDDIFDFVSEKRKVGSEIIMLFHDFHSICNNGHLIKNDGTKCGMWEGSCDCNPNAKNHFQKWRDFLINQTDKIVCFSYDSSKILKNFHPELSNKIIHQPHFVPQLRKVNIKKTKEDKELNIAVIGFTNKIKGCEIVREMSEIILEQQILAKIFVVGKFKSKTNKAIKVLGKYRREDLPKIMEDKKIDIVFISSICPETFSYTTNEAIMMGWASRLPVLTLALKVSMLKTIKTKV